MCSVSADDGPRKLELVRLASQTAIRATVSCQEPENAEKPQKSSKFEHTEIIGEPKVLFLGQAAPAGACGHFATENGPKLPFITEKSAKNRENVQNGQN